MLYRTSAQSRVFEDALRQRAIPYRVHGGFRFYERAEVKDVLAYLRLIANRDDDAAFERVVNTPNRGIGERSLELIRETARRESVSLWQATERLLAGGSAGARALGALRGFCILIERMALPSDDRPLAARVEAVIEASRLPEHYLRDKSERGEDRIENSKSCARAAGELVLDPESELDPLTASSRKPRWRPRARRRRRRRGGAHDPAFRQGPGVSTGVPGGPGRRPVSPPAQQRRPGPAPGGAAPLLLLDHARPGTAGGHPRRGPAPARGRELSPTVALHPRAAAELVADVGRASQCLFPVPRTDTAGGFAAGPGVCHTKFGEGCLGSEGWASTPAFRFNSSAPGPSGWWRRTRGLRAV